MTIDCAREQDVLDAVASNRWPGRSGDELRDHVRLCAVCADVAEIAGALAEERDRTWNETDVPPASLVWWRAQMRARAEATALAGRPILVAQGVAVVCLAAAAWIVFPHVWPWVLVAADSSRSLVAWVVPRAIDVSNAFALATGGSIPLLAVSVSAVLAPIVLLYFALVDP